MGFLAARAIPGVESVEAGRYRRTLMLPNGTGIMSVGPGRGARARTGVTPATSTASCSSRTCAT